MIGTRHLWTPPLLVLLTVVLASLLSAHVGTVHAWTPTTTTTTVSRHSLARTSTTQLFSSIGGNNNNNNVIDQLSPTGIAAVMVAHQTGHAWQQTELTNELLLLGVLEHPERAAPFLPQYPFLAPNDALYQAVRQVLDVDPALANENSNSDKTPLPFSKGTQQVLSKAYAIADHLGSRRSVRSEHVLLALLGYNFGRRTILSQTPVYKVWTQLDDATFNLFDLCEDLVAALSRQPNTDMSGSGGDNNNAPVPVPVGGEDAGAISGTLAQVGVDLTQLAMDGALDPVYGRDDEIRACLQTLNRRRKNNPCLVGEAGVGKTAIVEGLAQVLAQPLLLQQQQQGIQVKLPEIKMPRNPFTKDDDVDDENDLEQVLLPELPTCPRDLAGYRLVSVDLASLVAGTANRGDFEKRVQNLIRESMSTKVILFFDEAHLLLGAGDGGAMNAANLLKPALARGEIRIVGATTNAEFRKYIEKDAALERRFQPLKVQEPTVDQAVDILASIISKYEGYHKLEYTNNALRAAAKLSDRYIADRFLPDKAIDLVDEAGSMVKMQNEGNMFVDESEGNDDDDPIVVTEDDIALCVSKFTGIPVGQLDTGEKERLRNLESELKQRIKGQEHAVKVVAKAIRRARSGMRDGKRPVATFLFAGPTGVGKTELSKALATTYFGQEKDMIRIDMSEYMDRFSTSRLVGAPPGYVGYDEGGQLTEAVRRSPHSVILFDEMEKAHEDVLNILLQVMDDGILTDGKGRRVSFKNTVLVLTTNVGSQEIIKLSRSGMPTADISAAVQSELETQTRPEFLNRLDEIVVFNPLDYDKLREITSNLVKDIVTRVYSDRQMILTVSSSVQEAVTRETLAVASEFGARPLRRALQRYVEDCLAEAVISEFIVDGDTVKLSLQQQATDDKPAIVDVNVAGRSGAMSIPIDREGGLVSNDKESLLDSVAYGDLPDMDDDDDDDDDDGDDDEGLKRETSAFQ